MGDGVREVGADRDPVRHVVEVRAGIGSRLGAVDDREDLVLLRVAHQAVGGLAVGGAEERLGVDDGRLAYHEEPPGSGRLPPSKRGVRWRSPDASSPSRKVWLPARWKRRALPVTHAVSPLTRSHEPS